jgi:signal transduction histidine kinase
MSLSAISTENMSERQKEILHNSRFVIDEAIRSVREISNNMSPQILMDFGLSQGIHNFISRIKSLHDVEVSFETNLHEERFDNDIEVVMYRVICELINNSYKHSKCSKIEIVLMLEDDFLKLTYKDNGKGFNIDTQTVSKGMGLSNIASRIGSLNGTLNIISNSGNGMKAMVQIDTQPGKHIEKREERRRWRRRQK